MRKPFQLLLVSTLAAFSCFAGGRGFRFTRPIELRSSREELVEAELDAPVFAHTRNGFPDLRVLDGNGEEIPFLLEKRQRAMVSYADERRPAKVRSLKERQDNAIEVLAAPVWPNGRPAWPPAWLEIHTPLKNYEKRISVWGIDETGRSFLLADEQPIFDYSRFMDVRNERILLASDGVPFPTYRIVVNDVTDIKASALVQFTRSTSDSASDSEMVRTVFRRRDFRIDRLRFGRTARRASGVRPVTAPREVGVVSIEENEAEKRTEIVLTAAGQPLTGLRLQTGSRNFVRAVEVQAEVPGQVTAPWRTLGRGTVQNISFRGIERKNLQVSFPETRADRYRLIVENHDSPPLDFTAVEGVGPVYRVLFLAAPGKQLRLAYGSRASEQPVYDPGLLITLRRETGREIVAAALGEVRENEDFGQEWLPGDLLASPLALGLAVALVVAVLAWGIAKGLQGVEADSAPPSREEPKHPPSEVE